MRITKICTIATVLFLGLHSGVLNIISLGSDRDFFTLANHQDETGSLNKEGAIVTSLPAEIESAPIDFSSILISPHGRMSHGRTQDKGQYEVLDAGATLKVSNNGWKSIPFDYTISPNTVIEFEFKSDTMGEYHLLGMSSSEAWQVNRAFKLFGTQAVPGDIDDFNTYSGTEYQFFQIPIGQYYTGLVNRIFFAADHDFPPGNATSYFRNVRVFEEFRCTAGDPFFSDFDGDGLGDACDLDDDNDGILDKDECTFTISSSSIDFVGLSKLGGSFTHDMAGREIVPLNISSSNIHPGAGDDSSYTLIHEPGGGIRYQNNGPGKKGTLIEHSLNFDYPIPLEIVAGPPYGGPNSRMSRGGDKLIFVAQGTSRDFRWLINQAHFPGGGGSVGVSPDGKVLTIVAGNGGTEGNFTRFSISVRGLLSSLHVTHESLVNFIGYNSTIYSIKVPLLCFADADNLANHLDTDSDGDGCPDAAEGSARFILPDLDEHDRLNSAIDAKGIPTLVSPKGQGKGDSQNARMIDSDCSDCEVKAPTLSKPRAN